MGLVTGRSRARHCLAPASSTKHLGVELHDVTGTIKDAVEHRLSCMIVMIAAHSAVSRRLNDIDTAQIRNALTNRPLSAPLEQSLTL